MLQEKLREAIAVVVYLKSELGLFLVENKSFFEDVEESYQCQIHVVQAHDCQQGRPDRLALKIKIFEITDIIN